MLTRQGDLALLNESLAQELLRAPIPARLAYMWPDGTPRVIPMWFHWTGEEIVLCGPPNAPKMKVMEQETKVALTIDYEEWPARVLMIRGAARSEVVNGEIPEYPAITKKYLGEEQAQGWRQQYAQMFPNPIRITVQPEWVGIIDLASTTAPRFPSAIEAAMSG